MTLKKPVSVLNRMRLACTPVDANGEVLKCAKAGAWGASLSNRYADCYILVGDAGWQVMNEVTLHRGRHTHLTVVDAYFDGQHLTEAVVSQPRSNQLRIIAAWYDKRMGLSSG